MRMSLLVGLKSSWNEIGEVENVFVMIKIPTRFAEKVQKAHIIEWIFYFDGKNRMHRRFKDKTFSRLQFSIIGRNNV